MADIRVAYYDDIKDATVTIKQGGDIKGKFTVNQSSDVEIDLDRGIPVPVVEPVFGNNSWEDIEKAADYIRTFNLNEDQIKKELGAGWFVGAFKGDYITTSAGSIMHYYKIIDYNRDSYQGVRRGITLELGFEYTSLMNTVLGTQAADLKPMTMKPENEYSWRNTDMRNTIMTDIINNRISPELKNVIKPVNKSSNKIIGQGSGYIIPFIPDITDDMLFLFSSDEIMGSNAYKWYQNNPNPINRQRVFTGLGAFPPIGSEQKWWLRDVYEGNTSYPRFLCIGTDGNLNSSTVHNTPIGVSFGFCI